MQQCIEAFPQDTHHFCATVDRSNGTVSDSRVEWKPCTTVENVRGWFWFIGWFVTFTRVHVVWWLHVTIRKLQTQIPCGGNLSPVLVMRPQRLTAERHGVQTTTRHEQWRTLGLRWELYSNLHRNSQHNDASWKVHAQHHRVGFS